MSTGTLYFTYCFLRSPPERAKCFSLKPNFLSFKTKYPNTKQNSKSLAIMVPTAAPTSSSLGAPSFPNMNTQLKNRLMKNAAEEPMRDMLTVPTLLKR